MKLRRPPGPKPHFLIGNLALLGSSPLTTIRQWAEQYGDMFYYRAGWLHVYYFNHPDLVEYVLVRNPHNFVKGPVFRKAGLILGEGLITSDGEHWRRQRRLSQPGFTRDHIVEYSRCMTECADDMLAGWQGGLVVDIQKELMRLTLRVVMRALFDVETPETEEISRSFDSILHNMVGMRLVVPELLRPLLPGTRKMNRSIAQLNAAVYEIIRQRRQNTQAHAGSLLSILMTGRDEDGSQMSDLHLRDEIMTFLVGGHETTALTLTWALHLLSENPEPERQLHEEVDRVLGNRTPTMEDMANLPYTERVIKETMRMRPPSWSISRTALQDFEVGGYTIPRGASVILSQWNMHHNPRYFPEPDRFDPERWLRPTPEKLPKLAYFPFGGGYRQCLGGAFAMTESVLLLASVARRFQLRTMPDPPVVLEPSFTLRPRYRIRMQIEERGHGSSTTELLEAREAGMNGDARQNNENKIVGFAVNGAQTASRTS
jgi:cytochrome P450